MATEEDNFDIDIYGDGGEDYQQDSLGDDENVKGQGSNEPTSSSIAKPGADSNSATHPAPNGTAETPHVKHENSTLQDVAQKIASTDDSSQNTVHLPKQAPQTQGLKRQDGSDDRYVDPGATTALFISDLHWWVTDDDIRGWANQSQCEDELEDITFSEHKVNGKSKGQAYVLLKSPQAATAAKHKIESFGEGQQYTKKFAVNYTNPYTNPFRTLPKDGPMRNANNNRSSTGGYGNSGSAGNLPTHQAGFNNSGGGYRGNRGGGYNTRGGGGSNYNRGGFQQPAAGGYQGGSMGAFQNTPMAGMQQYGGFQNRGGMMGGMRGSPMGMRGGRGGMGPNGMMGMPMGNMGMPNMGAQLGGMGMGMPQMGMQGMPDFPVQPPHPTSGQYLSQAGTFGGSLSTPSAAVQPSTIGMSIGPSFSVMGFPNNAATPPVSYANPAQYQASAVSAASTPSVPFSGAPASFTNQPSPAQSGMLKRKLSTSGQGGFQGSQAQYNPAFFPQGQGGDASWNPHGAKRTRQE